MPCPICIASSIMNVVGVTGAVVAAKKLNQSKRKPKKDGLRMKNSKK